jgi:hypothetical protein
MRRLEKTDYCVGTRPYQPLREHPRYPELKDIVDNMTPSSMAKLKKYVEKWLEDVQIEPERR